MGRRGSADGPDGVVVVDKPAGMTSHDVVARARRALGTSRVGHAGTLDPGATGVLVLGVGRVTRLLQYLTLLPKGYAGEVVLGTETTTLDDGGEVTATFDMAEVTLPAMRQAAAALTGPILQVPPMVSALKVGGRRLHELAREGIEVERAPRPVTVHRFDVLGLAVGVAPVEVECSSGTYVRTLAADLGRALGGGAHLRRLRRTSVGPFTLAAACPLDELVLRPPLDAVTFFEAVEADPDAVALVGTGRRLPRKCWPGDGPWAVVADGRLLAVYEAAGPDEAKAGVVLAPK